MIRKYIIAGAAIVALTMPVLAATTYYVAQDATTKKCSVVATKPDGKTMMMVGKAGYTSQADAAAAIKANKDCK